MSKLVYKVTFKLQKDLMDVVTDIDDLKGVEFKDYSEKLKLIRAKVLDSQQWALALLEDNK